MQLPIKVVSDYVERNKTVDIQTNSGMLNTKHRIVNMNTCDFAVSFVLHHATIIWKHKTFDNYKQYCRIRLTQLCEFSHCQQQYVKYF